MQEHSRLATTGNLSKSVDDVQKNIDLLVKARESIAASTLYQLQWMELCPNFSQTQIVLLSPLPSSKTL